MRSAFSVYRHLLAASVRGMMQYKFSFVLTAIFNFFVSIADFLVVLAILYNFRAIGGWTTPQIGLLYGVVAASIGIYRTFGSELHNFQNYIINGEFDGLLLRPWPTLLVLLSRGIELFRIGSIIQGYLAMLVSLHYLGGIDGLGWKYLYFLALPFMSAGIFFAIAIATSSLTFWIGRVRELQTFTIYGPNTAAAYPTSIYPRWLRYMLTILPVTFVGYVPTSAALNLGSPAWQMATPLLVSIVSLYLAARLWELGEKAYHSTGS